MATITASAPGPAARRIKSGTIVIIIGTIVLLLFVFIEIVPFVLTISNSFKCQAAVQNAPGAIIPVPPFGVSCFDENGQRRPYMKW